MVAHAYILDVTRVNAQTIASANGAHKTSSFDFGWDLMMALAKPMMEARFVKSGIQTNLRASIGKFLKKGHEEPTAPRKDPPNSRQKCKICLDEMLRGPGYKKRKDKIRKYNSYCKNCTNAICDQHRVTTCTDCV